ncbi:Acyl-(acyl-carrier-protein) desaturase, chloroplastic [Hordeum vulgare]|nr:Acyl-(acyl-carrier-protein) desaturase, chloroplastic [Hordeum vulgare]
MLKELVGFGARRPGSDADVPECLRGWAADADAGSLSERVTASACDVSLRDDRETLMATARVELVCLVCNMVHVHGQRRRRCRRSTCAWATGWRASATTRAATSSHWRSGFRVDMRQVERTVHHLLRNGMYMLMPSIPYHNVIYGSFQDRATFISHTHTAKQAAHHGARYLVKICGIIAADEKRHQMTYTKEAANLFELNPQGMVRALTIVLRDKITMHDQLMTDDHEADLFDNFSAVVQRTGVYTARDYGDMVEHFVRRWKLADLAREQLSGEGRRAQQYVFLFFFENRAQEYVCGLPHKIRREEQLARDRASVWLAGSMRPIFMF